MKKLLLLVFLIGGYLLYRNYGYLTQSAQNYVPPKQKTIDLGISELSVPQGFNIDYFAKEIEGARSITVSDSGIVYVGTRAQGKVYALEDTDGDFFADTKRIIASDLNSPNGVVWHEGNLYVAEIDRILMFENIDESFKSSPTFEVIFDGLPSDTHHGWRYIDIGPDNKLYVPIGAACNICQTDNTVYGTLNRLNLDGTDFEAVARGIRNTVGFDWHPLTKALYFTDNGRDWLGDNSPPDEFNVVGAENNHFGYPYCHGNTILDPDFGDNVNCDNYQKPLVELGPHVAALGVNFYEGNMFPDKYKNLAFIAEHGSWNRSEPIGYRITLVDVNGTGFEVFADGWLDENGEAWGRPVDIEMLNDGSLLVSDDLSGTIYRISYRKN